MTKPVPPPGNVGCAVIGAGPYGLSVAAHLRARGVSVRVFGRTMDTWLRHMPAGMFLKSEARASNLSDPQGDLTLRRFYAERGDAYREYGVPVPLETFVEYGRWFQAHAAPDVEDVSVTALRRSNGGFALELSSGDSVVASSVVIAVGLANAPNLPSELGSVSAERVTHTSQHGPLDSFRGRTVAVIGGGQSALETAALLAEGGASPTVIVRKAIVYWAASLARERSAVARIRAPMSLLGPDFKLWLYTMAPAPYRLLPADTRVRKGWGLLGPEGAWWLRERVVGEVPLLSGHRLLAAEDDGQGVRLSLSSSEGTHDLCFDHVIAGTGFAPGIAGLTFLSPELKAKIRRVGNSAWLSPHFESSVHGLYLVGPLATNTFGPLMRFVCGCGFAAPRVAAQLRRTLGSRDP